MADFPLPDREHRTPLQIAHTPAMDEAARLGIVGEFCPIPEAFPAGSDIGNLSLFGYNPHTTFTGRAPLEAMNQGITLGADQVAFRCNLVALENGTMKDFTAGHISTEEATAVIEDLNDLYANEPLKLHPGVSYRHLAILRADPSTLREFVALKCTPPHDITDKAYEPFLPNGAGAEAIRSLMQKSQGYLLDHPVNAARRAKGKDSATSIWLWGQGVAPQMASYAESYSLRGAVVSAVDLVNGIGRGAGLRVIQVPGATGYLDTNYEGKVAAALGALEEDDFVYLHIEAPDEASHEGRFDLKLQAIEDFDRRVVTPCLDYVKNRADARMLVAPDHITALSTKTHAGGPVPFLIFGAQIELNEQSAYDEITANASGLCVVAGYAIVPHLIRADRITPSSLRALDGQM